MASKMLRCKFLLASILLSFFENPFDVRTISNSSYKVSAFQYLFPKKLGWELLLLSNDKNSTPSLIKDLFKFSLLLPKNSSKFLFPAASSRKSTIELKVLNSGSKNILAEIIEEGGRF